MSHNAHNECESPETILWTDEATVCVLPPEIWLHILDIVIRKRRSDDRSPEYAPFQAVETMKRDWSNASSTRVSLAENAKLALICKQWQRWTSRTLYAHLRIQHGTHGLLDGLRTRAGTPIDYGSFVRTIEIYPDIEDFDPLNPVIVCEILACCPGLEQFIRPRLSETGGLNLPSPKLPTGVPFPALPKLTRIDWWNNGSFPQRGPFDAERIPGFLNDLVKHSPNVQYFAFSQAMTFFRHPVDIVPKHRWSLEALTTLRLECDIPELNMVHLDAPNLRHLILSITHDTINFSATLLREHASHIKTLEIISFPLGAMNDTITIIWRTLPCVVELSIPLLFGVCLTAGRADIANLDCLEVLRIKLDQSTPAQSPRIISFLRHRLRAPNLERIVLHGSSSGWKANASYPLLQEYVAARPSRPLTLELVEDF